MNSMDGTLVGIKDVLPFRQGDDMPYNMPYDHASTDVLDFKRAVVALNSGIRGIAFKNSVEEKQ